jgi:hypothetical protein
MNDNLVNPGFNFVKEAQITLKPAEILVIDFNPDRGWPVLPAGPCDAALNTSIRNPIP